MHWELDVPPYQDNRVQFQVSCLERERNFKKPFLVCLLSFVLKRTTTLRMYLGSHKKVIPYGLAAPGRERERDDIRYKETEPTPRANS
jgi:hypothetical protein